MSGPGGWRRPPTWPAAGRHRTPATAPAPTPTPQPVVLADGRHPVFLKTVDPAGRSITFDLIQLSFGAEITIPLAAGLTLLMAGVMALPTQADAASTASPPPVPLGTHSFGHLARTDAIVAEAAPTRSAVPAARGSHRRPWTFEVAPTGRSGCSRTARTGSS